MGLAAPQIGLAPSPRLQRLSPEALGSRSGQLFSPRNVLEDKKAVLRSQGIERVALFSPSLEERLQRRELPPPPPPPPGHLSGAPTGECSRKCLASLPAAPGSRMRSSPHNSQH